ncbi:hypothetical protein GCM10010433_24890 [Streptomyces pulveraceus]
MTPVDGAAGIGVGPVAGADTGREETGPPGAVPRDPVDESLLTLLGLAPDEDAVYRLLVDRPDSEPDTLTGPLSGRAVTRVLGSLVERGLASAARPDGDGTVRYRAASPCCPWTRSARRSRWRSSSTGRVCSPPSSRSSRSTSRRAGG